MVSSTAAHVWLLSRVDRLCTDGVLALLQGMTEHLSLATSDAVTRADCPPTGGGCTR